MARKIKKAARKGRNPNDATLRNVRAAKKQKMILEDRIQRLEIFSRTLRDYLFEEAEGSLKHSALRVLLRKHILR